LLSPSPTFYKRFIKPLLFTIPPETAQKYVDSLLKNYSLWKFLYKSPVINQNTPEINIDGIKLKNPVGLAAGYDKDCLALQSLSRMGFGYLTCGTITQTARTGNASPRILRYSKSNDLVNSLGFPSKGLSHAIGQLERVQHLRTTTALIASISGITTEEISNCFQKLQPLCDAIEVNISSPNTEGLRVFQNPATLAELIETLNHYRNKPLFIKMPPYVPISPQRSVTALPEQNENVINLARTCKERGVSAITVSNTQPAIDAALAVGRGGLSGKSIFANMLKMVSELKSEIGNDVHINACGGIFSASDANQALAAGASTVQFYTGLIYEGPGIVKAILQGLTQSPSNPEEPH